MRVFILRARAPSAFLKCMRAFSPTQCIYIKYPRQLFLLFCLASSLVSLFTFSSYIRENAHALYLDEKKFHFFYVRMPFKVIWWWGTYVCGALRACMFFYIYKIHSCFFLSYILQPDPLKKLLKKVFNIHKEAELFNCFYNNYYHTKSVCVRFFLSLRPFFFLFDMNKVYLCYIAQHNIIYCVCILIIFFAEFRISYDKRF